LWRRAARRWGGIRACWPVPGPSCCSPAPSGTWAGRRFRHAPVVTPTLPEAQALTSMMTEDRAALAERLVAMGARAALVTGGHGAEPVDHLFHESRPLAIPVAPH